MDNLGGIDRRGLSFFFSVLNHSVKGEGEKKRGGKSINNHPNFWITLGMIPFFSPIWITV